MIARIFSGLALACILSSIGIYAEHAKTQRREPVMIQAPQQEAWLTKEQAQQVLATIGELVQEIQELSKQNRAPRTDAPGTCDPSFPGCGLVDLSGVLADLCLIENQVQCLCIRTASILELIGSCNDHSVLLGSQVDKSCIDSLCISMISLLKTILLELRGAFTGPFPCNVTP